MVDLRDTVDIGVLPPHAIPVSGIDGAFLSSLAMLCSPKLGRTARAAGRSG
jgi:hypothetical protein